MDAFGELRILRREINALKGAKLTHNLKIYEIIDEMFKSIDEEKKKSEKRHNEIIEALLSLGAQIENVSITNVVEKSASTERPSLAEEYKDQLMFIPDVEISGSTVRIKEGKKVSSNTISGDVNALEKALGG
ncbi:MAG: hypothetical protein GX638_16955 [Crenarchaeota archaeon]|nr:hypothetical protein [Thermoproteota archaeon]